MLMHGRAYPTISYDLDYRSVSTFHRQSLQKNGAKNLFFSAVEAVVRTWQNAVQRLSASIHTHSTRYLLTLFNNLMKKWTWLN